MCVFSRVSRVLLFATLWTVACQALLSWDSPGKNTRVGSHSLLQGIFPTQGLNLCLLLCRQILYPLSHLGNPGKAFSSSRAGCVESITLKGGSPFCPTALPVLHVCLPGTSGSLKHSRKCKVLRTLGFYRVTVIHTHH